MRERERDVVKETAKKKIIYQLSYNPYKELDPKDARSVASLAGIRPRGISSAISVRIKSAP